jgi:hypothetical protein
LLAARDLAICPSNRKLMIRSWVADLTLVAVSTLLGYFVLISS